MLDSLQTKLYTECPGLCLLEDSPQTILHTEFGDGDVLDSGDGSTLFVLSYWPFLVFGNSETSTKKNKETILSGKTGAVRVLFPVDPCGDT